MKPLLKMFLLEGRSTRTEYCTSFALCCAVSLLINDYYEAKIIGSIVIIWFMIAQGSKRAHDIGQSGLIQFIPFYNLSLFFIKGELKANKYGEVPKMNSSEVENFNLKNVSFNNESDTLDAENYDNKPPEDH